MPALSARVLDEIKELPGKYPHPHSGVLPALDLVQEELGYLTPDTIAEVAAVFNVDPGYIEGLATFYPLLHLKPLGRHHFYVCTNITCTLRGALDVIDHLKKGIGVTDDHEISKDGLFSCSAVECLGNCEYAPVARVDQRFERDLTHQKIDQLITEMKRG